MARIIPADDDPVIGQMVSVALLDPGHAVGWVADGGTALTVMLSRPPSLKILDCGMPGLSGVGLVRAMRAPAGCAAFPCMLTARQSDTDDRLALTAGSQDYLRKPVDLDELVGRVNALLFHASKVRAAG